MAARAATKRWKDPKPKRKKPRSNGRVTGHDVALNYPLIDGVDPLAWERFILYRAEYNYRPYKTISIAGAMKQLKLHGSVEAQREIVERVISWQWKSIPKPDGKRPLPTAPKQRRPHKCVFSEPVLREDKAKKQSFRARYCTVRGCHAYEVVGGFIQNGEETGLRPMP